MLNRDVGTTTQRPTSMHTPQGRPILPHRGCIHRQSGFEDVLRWKFCHFLHLQKDGNSLDARRTASPSLITRNPSMESCSLRQNGQQRVVDENVKREREHEISATYNSLQCCVVTVGKKFAGARSSWSFLQNPGAHRHSNSDIN